MSLGLAEGQECGTVQWCPGTLWGWATAGDGARCVQPNFAGVWVGFDAHQLMGISLEGCKAAGLGSVEGPWAVRGVGRLLLTPSLLALGLASPAAGDPVLTWLLRAARAWGSHPLPGLLPCLKAAAQGLGSLPGAGGRAARQGTDSAVWPWQDIEKTMSTALNELRELERQNTAKQAPDVVLDTLEPMKNPPLGAANSEPASPLHTILIRDPEAALRRSSSSTAEMLTTFKPALSARLAGTQLRPPPMRPLRPVVQHRSSSSSSSGVGSPAVTPTEKLFPGGSADKSGTM